MESGFILHLSQMLSLSTLEMCWRLSIGTIYSVRYDGEMYPASNLVSENTPPLFKRVTVEEYFGNLCARKLRGKSHLDALRIEHIQD
ncbi:hypothetical protein CUMW_161060 [Citrus unshiu]|uniref:Uncharacterized protein n=1 Tax=Citrus unshiu TaxID=55188 RepID=A0A2H5PRL1_CITUN|nr:hypothetical protein CUMW_161060 [Citrus unshiu]